VKSVIIGTAGHVDHGKTSVVKALTGVDTDRLPEEKKRGMSIELGFAPLSLSPTLQIGLIDVPGHEKFVHTMLGGAMGIDLALIVVAANEGVCQQTVEHLKVLKGLGIHQGVCALTKIDLVENIEEPKEKVFQFLAENGFEAEVIPISVLSGVGINDLKLALLQLAQKVPPPLLSELKFLPIDRVFALPGFGTIVTGTLLQGKIRVEDRIQIFPSLKVGFVRSLQTFGQTVKELTPKVRAAVNINGISKDELKVGEILTSPGHKPNGKILKVAFEFGQQSLKPTRRYRFFHLGQKVSCRVIHSELRLQKPVYVQLGGRFVLRTESPPETIAGGKVIEIVTRKMKSMLSPILKKEVVLDSRMLDRIHQGGVAPLFVDELAREFGKTEKEIHAELKFAADQGILCRISMEMYVSKEALSHAGKILKEHFQESSAITLAKWKELIGTSRKYALPWLTYFDQEKLTLCKPDKTRVAGPRLA